MVARTPTHAKGRLLAGSLIDEQIERELESVRRGAERYRKECDDAIRRGEGASLKPAEKLMVLWFRDVSEAIRQDLRSTARGERKVVGQQHSDLLLNMIDHDRLALIVMHETISHCMSEGGLATFTRLAYSVGRAVLAEVSCDELRKNHREAWDTIQVRMSRMTPRRILQYSKPQIGDHRWNRTCLVQSGTRLLWNFCTTAMLPSDDGNFRQLAFLIETVQRGGKRVRVVRCMPATVDAIERGHASRQHMRPRYMPMVVTPLSWHDDEQGGYLRIRTPFIAKPTPEQKRALAAADLRDVHQCLDALSATAWEVDRDILDVMKEVWDDGGGRLRIPRAENFPMPDRVPPEMGEEAIKKNKAARSEVWGINSRLIGAREEFRNRLDVADSLRDRRFWFPHQLDFRGRCYPVPIYLNHHGDDVCRGLLRYAVSKPMDAKGEMWLKIHAANCYGFDKATFADRVAWVDKHIAAIHASAERPLQEPFWESAEKPWQFLAACRAIRYPDIGAKLPVQMDGTCNGLQHYAAMTRDAVGGALVNLVPCDRPADVYAAVAEAVAPRVRSDCEKNEMARLVVSLVNRSVVKQPVMTKVYGVTRIGARDQIAKQLAKAGIEDKKQLRKAAMYLANATLEGIGDVCGGASQAMEWLRESAKLIATKGRTVSWTTPLGFPVVQPYRNLRRLEVATCVGDVYIGLDDESAPVKTGKQKDGLAPNFVHSIDSTHMLMTALDCRENGIEFAEVHDSYWCHANDVPAMMKSLREQFVDLHSAPLLADLRTQFCDRHPDIEFPQAPATGTLDIREVLKSPYFFS